MCLVGVLALNFVILEQALVMDSAIRFTPNAKTFGNSLMDLAFKP